MLVLAASPTLHYTVKKEEEKKRSSKRSNKKSFPTPYVRPFVCQKLKVLNFEVNLTNCNVSLLDKKIRNWPKKMRKRKGLTRD